MDQTKPRYLVMVDTKGNNNKYYKMIPRGNGTWTAEYGRVGSAPQSADYSMSQWDKKYNEKVRKGYTDRTNLIEDAIVEKKVKTTAGYKDIENAAIAEIVERLMNMARGAIRTNYNISSELVTQAMVNEAQSLIDKLSFASNTEDFNEILGKLFAVIPRRMGRVSDYMAANTQQFAMIIKREQDLLDVMRGQVVSSSAPATTNEDDEECTNEKTILEANGLIFEPCSREDIATIKIALGTAVSKFKQAWKVTNLSTQERFDKFVKTNDIKDVRLLFHGSRNENWWSIINSGLKLHPQNAVITGKLYGIGTYFAPKAEKSIGYTSLQGSYWAGGSSKSGFLALMEVAYGTPYDVYDFDSKYYNLNYESLQKYKRGANCLHAHAGANIGHTNLRNDEIVIYKEEQCTIKYLVEIE